MEILIFPIRLLDGNTKWIAIDFDNPKISAEGATKEEAEERLLKKLMNIWSLRK